MNTDPKLWSYEVVNSFIMYDFQISSFLNSAPRLQESDEGESSFMKHTQHLVDIMEARISRTSQVRSIIVTL
jgi:hypothetical protein